MVALKRSMVIGPGTFAQFCPCLTGIGCGVQPAPSFDTDHEIWAENAHPFASKIAFAVGTSGSTFSDHGMTWDNSGKNGHYAPISWSG